MVQQMSSGIRCRRAEVAGFSLLESTYAPGIHIRPHAHANAKISMIIAGGTEETSLRTVHCCGKGSVVSKPAGADHSNVFSPTGMRTLIIYRKDEDSENSQHWDEALSQYEWYHGGIVVRQMLSIYQAMVQGHTDGIEENIYDLTSSLQVNPHERATNSSPRWLYTVREYIHAHFMQSIEVQLLATMVGTHPVYLTRVFRRKFGCTVTEYLQRLRTKHALLKLTSSTATIAGIAMACGFADHARRWWNGNDS